MEQVNTGVSLKSIRIQKMRGKIARLESESDSIGSNALFDALILKLRLRNDAALARRLAIHPSMISGIRSGRQPVSAGLLLRVHEESGLPIKDLKALAGI